MKFILKENEEGFEKVNPLSIIKKSDKENNTCKLRSLLYFSVPESDTIFEDYIDKHLVSDIKEMLLQFHITDINIVHIQKSRPPISVLCGNCGKAKNSFWKDVEKYSEEYDVYRIFLYIEIPNCPLDFSSMQESVERNLALFIRTRFEEHLMAIEKMDITNVSDSINIYSSSIANIYRDRLDLETLDFAVHFDPQEFQYNLENFEEAVKRDVDDPNLEFKIEQDEWDLTFSLILLHPLEVQHIIDSPLGSYILYIEDYINGDKVSEEDISEYVGKYGEDFEIEEDTFYPSKKIDIVKSNTDQIDDFDDEFYD